MKRLLTILVVTLILAAAQFPAQAQVTQPMRAKFFRICNTPELIWAMGNPGWLVRSAEQYLPASTENGLTQFVGVRATDGDPCFDILMTNREWEITEDPPVVLVEWRFEQPLSIQWNQDIQGALRSRGQQGVVVPFPTPIPVSTPIGGKKLP